MKAARGSRPLTGEMEHCHMPREAECWTRRSRGKSPFVCPDTYSLHRRRRSEHVQVALQRRVSGLDSPPPPPRPTPHPIPTTHDPQLPGVQEWGGPRSHKRHLGQERPLPISMSEVRRQFRCTTPTPTAPLRHPHLHQVVCYDFMIIYGALSSCACTFTTPSWSPLITGPRR